MAAGAAGPARAKARPALCRHTHTYTHTTRPRSSSVCHHGKILGKSFNARLISAGGRAEG